MLLELPRSESDRRVAIDPSPIEKVGSLGWPLSKNWKNLLYFFSLDRQDPGPLSQVIVLNAGGAEQRVTFASRSPVMGKSKMVSKWSDEDEASDDGDFVAPTPNRKRVSQQGGKGRRVAANAGASSQRSAGSQGTTWVGSEARDTLKRHFGFSGFRNGQELAVGAALQNQVFPGSSDQRNADDRTCEISDAV